MTAPPQILGGRYEVGELLGRGGMAEVHLGHDTRLSRPVAIKMLRSDLARDPSFLVRFRREAQSAAGLNHASIVAVYDSGEDHVVESGGSRLSIPYIVMEYVEGQTLRELLNDRSPLEPAEAARITEGILDALSYSHRMGIVHRDIKPANVMIGKHGEIKVMDFGIARAVADTSATMTQTQAVIGTAQYLSPEQAQGHTVDARSDLYSTGCLLFELLTGRPPFKGDSPVAIAYQHVGEAPPRPSTFNADVDASLDAVVLHALVKDREARYQDAASFRADLQAARLGRPISAAARGTAAGAAGAGGLAVADQTVALDTLSGERTTVLGAGAAAAAAGAGLAAAGRAGGPGDEVGAHGNTATLPAIGHDPDDEEPRKRRGLGYVLLVLAVLGAIALLAVAGRSFFGNTPSGAATVAVPGVIDMPVASAEAKIRAAELVPQVQQVPSTKDEGTVVDQNPQEGEKVQRGSKVTLSVSGGPSTTEVPNLAGFTVDEAKQALSNVGLTFGGTQQVNNTRVDKGNVIESSPAAGTSVDVGSAVTLKVSSGKVEVPDVTGMTRDEAASALSDLGFRNKTTYVESTEPEDTVLKQSIAKGELADYGTQITLTVARPAPPTPTQTTPTQTPTTSDTTSPTDTPSLPLPTSATAPTTTAQTP
ncbi:serine/threonine protein kinase [Pedococcus cremeus]|uniref:non-specific serine/threonine protein kinase n=1 Tax=Pedococcus cremeus TaxID=587636 RepID=A0A1H9XPY5_9MICO|nr:Stk1 family PASTA domain-containing Ser/Thr kinase [Pedococcus cremeus]SES48079.1 serine/threonine protein kinase [Pedococcus cremeus]